ncbi:DUF29 domain-containing protein [Massilia sp. B-10]|nr:DUF29 domain-containing protein [Massilia sp. B-10]
MNSGTASWIASRTAQAWHAWCLAFSTRAYAGAVRRAAAETGLPQSAFPTQNPYPADALLDLAFIP